MKRENYISWNEYFMGIALMSAKRSKDPNRQVGACIVKDNQILSTGYNGFPKGCSDNVFPWNKEDENDIYSHKKYYVVHAELNAILNSHGTNLNDSTIYVDLFPCNECAKAIIQSGITKVVYLSDEDRHKNSYNAAQRMFSFANVECVRIEKTEFLEKLMKL